MAARLTGGFVVFLFLLALTLVFKFFYLRTVFGREGIARGLGLAPLDAGRFSLAALQFASSDVIQVALIAIVISVVALPFRRWRTIGVIALVIAAIAGFINFLACRQIGTLVTLEHLGVTWSWLSKYPRAAFSFFNSGTPVRLAIAAIGLAVAVVIARRALAIVPRSRRASIGAAVISLVMLAVAGAYKATRPSASIENTVSTPYWTAALASLTMSDRINPLGARVRTAAELERDVGRMEMSGNAVVMGNPAYSAVRQRYVVIVSLESAPLALYPIIDNPEFPAFARMSTQGLSALHHYAPIPRTTEAIYSLSTGQYPVDDIARVVVRHKSRPTFLHVLDSSGFRTTFVDAFSRLGGWFDPGLTLWKTIGFSHMRFGTSNDGTFEGMAKSERASFNTALAEIDSARAQGKGSLVVIATAIGHYPWPVSRGATSRSPKDVTHGIAKLLDSETGHLIAEIERRGIADSTVLVVTGDHGLRFRAEFNAVGRAPDDAGWTYQVPFLLYAPGAIGHTQITAPTSHIDLAPTLAALLGVNMSGVLVHGRDLRAAPPDRAVYISSVGLSPFTGMVYGDRIYMMNTLTGRFQRTPISNTPAKALDDSQARTALDFAKRTIDESVAYQFSPRSDQ
jgi:hypothetical protein